MKKLAGLLVLIVVIYAIYNDLSAGTLPAGNMKMIEAEEKADKKSQTSSGDVPFFEHEVKPGDTLLSVLDSESKTPLSVPVSKAVEDFKRLNDGTAPQKIKFGRTYKFPDYSNGNGEGY
jgi:hypothetical protein